MAFIVYGDMLTRIFFSTFSAVLFFESKAFSFSFFVRFVWFGSLFLRHHHLLYRHRCRRLFVYFHLSVTFHVPALNHTYFFLPSLFCDKFVVCV